MKKRMIFIKTALGMLSSMLLLAACGGQEGDSGRGRRPQQAEEKQETEEKQDTEVTPAAAAPPAQVTQLDDGAIHVSSAEELVKAIAPGADIVLEPGVYNLSEYLESPDASDTDHVQISENYDGRDLQISGVEGLTIRGASAEDTEIIIDPRSADVLRFVCCTDITLKDLTMGHSVEAGACEGEVLDFYECSDITLSGMDLYGCGTYGINASRVYGLDVQDSVIHDCSSGGVYLSASTDTGFRSCSFTGIEGYELISGFMSRAVFTDCGFSGNDCEDMVYAYRGYVEFKGCDFGEAESAMLEENMETADAGSIVFDGKCRFAAAPQRSVVIVDDAEGLLEAIAPDTTVVLKPGSYDLSAYLQKKWDEIGEGWNRKHPYAKISDTYDGVELLLEDVDGLVLLGASGDCMDTQIVITPRYSTVMRFADSERVTLANLSMGHTQGQGICYGNVLDFSDCSDVILANMDIYGCGDVGVYVLDGCKDFDILDCTLRECATGPVVTEDIGGTWYFRNCDLVDSAGGGAILASPDLGMYFIHCRFGERESANYYYLDEVVTEDCTWSDIDIYSDLGIYDPPMFYVLPGEFHTEDLSSPPAFDEAVLADSEWYGFAVSDPVTGETEDAPYYINFGRDGSGWFEEEDKNHVTTWSMNSDYGVTVSEGGKELGRVVLYSTKEEGVNSVYLQFVMNGRSVWFVRGVDEEY